MGHVYPPYHDQEPTGREPYYTYRLVESLRESGQVRQRTLLNSGRHFEVPRERWPALVQRIEQLLSGQQDLMPADLDAQCEGVAQRYAAQLIRVRAHVEKGGWGDGADYHSVDVDSLEMLRPRSVAIEHVALVALRQVGLDKQLQALGFNGPQRAAAIGTLVARVAAPGSLPLAATPERTGRADRLRFLRHGAAGAVELGKSKEKRSDCPLVTLALVLDASGFPKRSEIFAGNISEPETPTQMLGKLASGHTESAPTVVLDAGIASEENIAWLAENGYRYLVVSRRRHREFAPDHAELIKEDGELTIRAQRRVNAETREVDLYCHSSQCENKERGIAKRFEAALAKLAEVLHNKGASRATTRSWSALAACVRNIHAPRNTMRSASSRTPALARSPVRNLVSRSSTTHSESATSPGEPRKRSRSIRQTTV